MGSLGGSNIEAYVDFQTKWREEQEHQAQELRNALDGDTDEVELRELVRKVEKHYEDYYVEKEGAVSQDVLTIMKPAWKSPLETAFMWIGGWRPTMVFQLAYAQAGQLLEAELAEFLQGLDTPSMASLSSKQLQRISNLQIATQKEEDELTYRQAIIQQGLVDQPLLTLAIAQGAGEPSEQGEQGNTLTDAVDEKVKALEDLCHDADNLRCATLKQMLRILTPVQAAQYLVAAAQLQMAIRRIGLTRQEANDHKDEEAHEQYKNAEEDQQHKNEPELEQKDTQREEKQDSL